MKLFISFIIIFFCVEVYSQARVDTGLKKTMDALKSGDAEGNSLGLGLRDPFKRDLPKKSRGKSRFKKGNAFTNSPTLQDVPLENIKIVGILLGKERRALAKVGTTADLEASAEAAARGDNAPLEDIYTIKEGMKLGVNSGEVRAILPGGIVIVEKIRNVYDQDEYLETIIPLSE